MPAKRHASLFVLLSAILLFVGTISVPAHGQYFGGAVTNTVGTGLYNPYGVAVDGAGNVFIADSANGRVVEVPANGGAQTTVPATGLLYPYGVAVDGAGNVFITDPYNNRVVKVAPGGGQTTMGSGLSGPAGVAVDGAGNVFIADTDNNRVVKVPAGGGAQTTVPATGLLNPWGVALDGVGDIFIADTGNNRVVEVLAGGSTQITVDDGLTLPRSVAVDGAGNVFIADTGDNMVVEVAANGYQISVGGAGYGLVNPFGVAVNVAGDHLFIAEHTGGGYVVEVQLIAVDFGSVNVCPGGQTAPAPCSLTIWLSFSIEFDSIAGVKVVTQGAQSPDFTLTDAFQNPDTYTETLEVAFAPTAPGVRQGAVQLTDPSGNLVGITLIHGIGEGPAVAFGPGTQAAVPASGLNTPYGVALDGAGNVFIADSGNNRVVEVRGDGGAQITVGTGLSNPTGVAVDGAGDVFIADEGNSRVVEVPVGCTTEACQVTVGSGLSNVFGVTVDGEGNVFVADSGNSRVVKVPAAGNGMFGAQTTVGSGLFAPRNVAVDGAGNVFIADSGNNRVVEVPANGGAQTTLGIGLKTPTGVALDAAGNVFIADSGNNRIMRFGGGRELILVDGLSYPTGVAVDAVGDVYFTQQGIGTHAAKFVRSQPPALSFASTPVGTTSSDSPYLVVLQNIGNQPLNAVAPGLARGTDFVQVPGPGNPVDCTSSFVVAPAAACVLGISFEPQSVGTFGEQATFTDNTLNFAPYATQSVTLQGTGLPSSQATATILSSSQNPSSYGNAVTLAATIIPQLGGQATGTVTFKDGATTLATAAVSGNVAMVTTSKLADGTHLITAAYSGDAHFTGSSAASLAQVVQKGPAAPSGITLTSSVNPAVQGKPVLLAVAVYPLSGGGVPTGKVTFYNGSTVLGAASLVSEVAKITTTALPAGPLSLIAVYAGDANYTGSTSAPLDELVIAATKVTVTSSPSPSGYGQPVTLSAAVTSSGGHPPDGETVTFKNGTAVLGTGTLSSGTATFSTSVLPVGTASITAVYGGDIGFAAATSTAVKQVVSKAATMTSILSSLSPSAFGQAVTFVAIVPAQFGGTVTGTVTFKNGTASLGAVPLSGSVATFTTTKLAPGTWSITAVYGGNASFAPSTSTLLPQVVTQASTTTTLVSSLNPSTYKQSVTFTATVVGQFGGIVTGSVTFMDGTTALATVNLGAGIAKYASTTLPVGTHNITATYNGGTDFTTSSGGVTQTVN